MDHTFSLVGIGMTTVFRMNTLLLVMQLLFAAAVSGVVLVLLALSQDAGSRTWAPTIVVVLAVSLVAVREVALYVTPAYYAEFYGGDEEVFDLQGRRVKQTTPRSKWPSLLSSRRKIAVLPSSRYLAPSLYDERYSEKKLADAEDSYHADELGDALYDKQPAYFSQKRKPGSLRRSYNFAPDEAETFDYHRMSARRTRRRRASYLTASLSSKVEINDDGSVDSEAEDEEHQEWIIRRRLTTRQHRCAVWSTTFSPAGLKRRVSFSDLHLPPVDAGTADPPSSRPTSAVSPLQNNTIALNHDSLLLPAPTYHHGFSSAGETSAEEGEGPSARRMRQATDAPSSRSLQVNANVEGEGETNVDAETTEQAARAQQRFAAAAVNMQPLPVGIAHDAGADLGDEAHQHALQQRLARQRGRVTSQSAAERPSSASQVPSHPLAGPVVRLARPRSALPSSGPFHLPRPHQPAIPAALAESSLISSSGSDRDSEHGSFYHEDEDAFARGQLKRAHGGNQHHAHRRARPQSHQHKRTMRPASARGGIVLPRPTTAPMDAQRGGDIPPHGALKDAAVTPMTTATAATTGTSPPSTPGAPDRVLPASSGLSMTHRQRERLNRLYRAHAESADKPPARAGKAAGKATASSAQARAAPVASDAGAEAGPGGHSAQARRQDYLLQPPRDYGFRVINQHHHHYHYYLTPTSPPDAAMSGASAQPPTHASSQLPFQAFPDLGPGSRPMATNPDALAGDFPSALMVAHFHDEYAPPTPTAGSGSVDVDDEGAVAAAANAAAAAVTGAAPAANVTVHHVHHYNRSPSATASGSLALTQLQTMPLPWTPMTSPSRNRHSGQFRVSRMLSGQIVEDDEDDDGDEDADDPAQPQPPHTPTAGGRSSAKPKRKKRLLSHQSLRQRRRVTRQAFQRSQQLLSQQQSDSPVAVAPEARTQTTLQPSQSQPQLLQAAGGGAPSALPRPNTSHGRIQFSAAVAAPSPTSLNARILPMTRPVENMYFGMRDMLLATPTPASPAAVGGFMLSRPGSAAVPAASSAANASVSTPQLRYQGRPGSGQPASPLRSQPSQPQDLRAVREHDGPDDEAVDI